jgi:hypothetical protein
MKNKKRENKIGQVTMFVIIAIAIVAIIVIVILVLNNKSSIQKQPISDLETKAKTDVTISAILGCMKDISSDSLEYIGMQGGYYNAPNDSYDFNGTLIPYYYKNGKDFMPSDSKIQDELGSYVDFGMPYCLNLTKSSDVELSYSAAKTNVKINENDVIFNIDMPISIKRGEKITAIELKNSPITINSKLFEMLEIAKYVTDSNIENSSTFCISCVSHMAEDRNLSVDIISAQANKTNLVIISQNISSDIHPAVFEFLNKY